MYLESSYYTVRMAAKHFGVANGTIRKYIKKLDTEPATVGQAWVLDKEMMHEMRKKFFVDGLSHQDIADKYGIGRTNVIYHLNNLNVTPLGIDARRHGAPSVYSERTINRIAEKLGWDSLEPQSQSVES